MIPQNHRKGPISHFLGIFRFKDTEEGFKMHGKAFNEDSKVTSINCV